MLLVLVLLLLLLCPTALPQYKTQDSSTVQPLPSISLSRAGGSARIKAVLNLSGQSVSGVLILPQSTNPSANRYDFVNNNGGLAVPAGFGNSAPAGPNDVPVSDTVPEFGFQSSFAGFSVQYITDLDTSGRITVSNVFGGRLRSTPH
jgi:hypothetical protein